MFVNDCKMWQNVYFEVKERERERERKREREENGFSHMKEITTNFLTL